MSGGELVLTAQHEHVRVLTLHRPEALNAIDDELATALGDAVAEAEADPGTRVITEVRRGLIAAAGGAMRLPQQVPPKLALEKLLTGDRISPRRPWGGGWSMR